MESKGSTDSTSSDSVRETKNSGIKALWAFAVSLFFLVTYDLVIWFFDAVIHTFFREVRLRGTFNIPKKGAVIFVCAPHHNQFVDPVVMMTTVRKASGRRVSLLTAAKSYRRGFIGIPARLCSAIPVERAQDLVKSHDGTIWVENFGPDNDNLTVIGKGTHFTTEAMEKGLIGLVKFLGNAQIAEVVSDTELKLKKPFKVNFENPNDKDNQIIDRLTNGTEYVMAPYINNHHVFLDVFDHLNADKALGIFPEGGLHDRPTLLPLKPGVAIMALGAVAKAEDPDQVVHIVPVGLNYFHAHKFRSRVVIEFGKPIVLTKSDGKDYEKNSREVVNHYLELITLRLNEVTVTCDDYDTLIAIQAARRLYVSNNRELTPLPLVVEMNRRLIRGYQQYSDRADVKALRDAVGEYNNRLMQLGLHDHQVESLTRSSRWSVLVMFLNRLFKVFLFMGLAMPGVFMFSPIFVTASRISRQKAKEALAASVVKIKANDVISTWKILVALGLAPMVYIFWAVIATIFWVKTGLTEPIPHSIVFIICYLWSVLTTYASLRVGEIGVDYYKSLTPLFYSLMSLHKDLLQIEDLKKKRSELALQVTEFCQRYGPSMFDDYDRFYRDYKEGRDHWDQQEFVNHEQDDTISVRSNSSFSLSNLGNIPIFSNPSDERDSSDERSLVETKDESELALKNEPGQTSTYDGEHEEPHDDEAHDDASPQLRLRRAMRSKLEHRN